MASNIKQSAEEVIYGKLCHAEWSEEDQVYIARVLTHDGSYSFLAAHGDTPEKTLRQLELPLADAVFGE